MNIKLTTCCLGATLFTTCGLNALQTKPVTADQPKRFAVVRYTGTSEFPHANQLTLGVRPDPNNLTVSKSDFEHVLVADLQKEELYLYSRCPLWRSDIGGLDEFWKTVWHQRGNAVERFDFEMGHSASSTDTMWSPINMKSLFVDILGLPVKEPLVTLKRQIEKCCERIDFGKSESRTEGISITQRVVNDATGEVVVKNTVAGKLFASASAMSNPADKKSAKCKISIYLDDKPMESMNGVITCSFVNSLPTSIIELLPKNAASHDKDALNQAEDRELPDLKQEEQSQEQRGSRWWLLGLAFGLVLAVLAIAIRLRRR